MISLILPAHNEANSIRDTVYELDRELSRAFAGVEILVVDDGSTDNTLAQLDGLNISSQLILIHQNAHAGKGKAVRTGLSVARGTVVAYTDADMPISPVSVVKAIAEVDSGLCDVCVGDRRDASSPFLGNRQRTRIWASWAYKTFARLVFAQLPRDPACCLKVFSGDIAARVAADATLDNYLFDIEAVLIAGTLQANIKEVAVDWVDKRSKLSLFRLLAASVHVPWTLIVLKINYASSQSSRGL